VRWETHPTTPPEGASNPQPVLHSAGILSAQTGREREGEERERGGGRQEGGREKAGGEGRGERARARKRGRARESAHESERERGGGGVRLFCQDGNEKSKNPDLILVVVSAVAPRRHPGRTPIAATAVGFDHARPATSALAARTRPPRATR
jgi:hypothetical protein